MFKNYKVFLNKAKINLFVQDKYETKRVILLNFTYLYLYYIKLKNNVKKHKNLQLVVC